MTDEDINNLPTSSSSSSSSAAVEDDSVPPTAVPKPDRNEFTLKETAYLNEITSLKEKQTRIYSRIDAIDKAKEEFQVRNKQTSRSSITEGRIGTYIILYGLYERQSKN
jgi:hypothetical protein